MDVCGKLGFYEWFDKKSMRWVPCEFIKSSGHHCVVKDLHNPNNKPHVVSKGLLSILGTHNEKNKYQKETEELYIRIGEQPYNILFWCCPTFVTVLRATSSLLL